MTERRARPRARLGEKLLGRLESADQLDAVGERLAGLVRQVVRPGVVEDSLSGTALGHPVHPAAVAVPIGAWTCTSVFDALGNSSAARTTQAIGVLSALPAAASGASDWLSTSGAERRVGLVHAALNYAALSLHVASWWSRGRGRDGSAKVLAALGTGLTGASGWLGGHLAYALGVGVDTTAFQSLPAEWTDVGAVADVPASGLHHAEAENCPILLARHGGEIVAYADRCTHRGAPLHEGEIADGCVVCPWHGSAFALADGQVRSGPATRPQPKLDVRVDGDRVLVRRDEERTLRANPVGP